MSEQATETRAQKRAREAAEAASSEQGTGEATPDGQAPDGEQAPELTPEQVAEAAKIAAVSGFTVAPTEEFRTATTPVRKRSPVQAAMDAVAASAYADWIKADRPSTWSRMPVITYFLDPEEVEDYKRMIRRAVLNLDPDDPEKANGVRARFGKEFPLTEKMAEKIGKPDEAGKTVLAWAAVDKRKVTTTNGDN
jgi:hypothetical protein